jgi:uncharacterized LabA/DUF88 family protein
MGDPGERGAMNSSEKLALFIDGQNLHFTAKGLGFNIDFKRFLAEFKTRGVLVRAYYYTIIAEEFQTTRPLIDWLDYNGFTVRTNSVKEFDDGEGRRKFKRNIGIELAVDAFEIAKHVDHIVLFSGDGDFRPLVEAIQSLGPRVTVVSSMRTKPAMVADELRRQADTFLELDDLKASIGRTMEQSSERNKRDEHS